MALNYEERLRIEEHFDVYDLVEELDLTVWDVIDAFEDRIEYLRSIMERIGG